MAYKLAIADIVGIVVKGATHDADGNEKPFKFTLTCDRLLAADLKATMTDTSETTTAFFEKHAKNWSGQDLVLDQDGRPAPFSLEALQAMFTISGMSTTCWQAYLMQVGATAKN